MEPNWNIKRAINIDHEKLATKWQLGIIDEK